jgi:beta-lactamase regulating signal transducer with metallopeptidase domain
MDTWIDVAGWTLVHFVWQGAAIAAGAALGFYVLRGTAANTRYLLASAALCLMLLSPVVTAFVVSSPVPTLDVVSAPPASVFSVLAPAGARLGRQNAGTQTQPLGTESALQRLPRAFPVIVVTWLAGVAILLTRLLGGWWRVRTLQRAARVAPPSRWQAVADRLARRLGVRRTVRVADADTVATPTVVGSWRPIILLPVAALSGLTPSQTDAILAHELAHIRRHDYLVNLFQHVAETVFFYHPAVWWISHRMRVEREQCCDAIVVDLCADPVDYATALMRLEEARHSGAGFALAATGGSLLARVRVLLGATTDPHTPRAHALVTTIMIALVVLVVGGGYHWSSRTLQAHEPTAVSAAVTSEPTQPAGLNEVARILPAKEAAPVRATEVSAIGTAGPIEPVQQQLIAVAQVDSERLLEDALRLENPPTDMTLAVEVNYFQLNRAEYAVPVSVRIPGSELALARSRGAERTAIDFIGEVKDAYGIIIQNVRDRLDVRLSDDSGAQLATRSIQYETALTMLPGSYSLRLAARDAETGRIGTFRTTFQIPNLNKEEKTVPISTVVLGSQLVPLNGAARSGVSSDPLVYDGLKLIPSVTREFSTSRDMYVFLQAYQRNATTTQPLEATVALYRDGVKALETAPLRVTEGLEPRSKAVPVRLTVPLGGLAPGVYDCEVSVVDTVGQKVTFWRTPVVLVP